MVPLVILGIYLLGFVLTTRYRVYKMMCYNEKTKFYGEQLEAKLYSRRELYKIARKNRSYVYFDSMPSSDWAEVLFPWSYLWPMYLLKGGFVAATTKGLRKTPGQRKAELKAREKEAAKREAEARALEQKYEEEFQRRMKEAGIEDE